VTGGSLADATGRERVDGSVVIDSRRVRPGSLFVAVVGDRHDGHDFAAAAVAAGAAGVLAARPVGVPAVVVGEAAGPRSVDDGPPEVVVALGRLARAVLAEAQDLTVTAITGSSGKTSTKDLVAQVLPRSGPTLSPEGSFNNDLGVPSTVLRLEPVIRHLVLEMGTRGPGQIARLCRIAPPHIGVVLNVGTAHLGEFGSSVAIAAAKSELVAALPENGAAVLNADDPYVAAMAGVSAAPVIWFGTGARADVTASHVVLDDEGRPSFRLHTPDGAAEVRLRLVGAHHVGNALATAAAAHRVGLAVDPIAAALSAAGVRSRWRMEVHRRPDGVTVINDAYNANPDSVRAALSALAAVGRGGRTWAVLGEMLELGDRSAAEHTGIGRLATRLGITRIVAVGAGAHPIHLGASEGPGEVDSVSVADRAAALALLQRELRPGDTVLVKSSRDAGLRQLGEDLVMDAPPTTNSGSPRGRERGERPRGVNT
jgi:UDP-N-acetylmuramoyl-tripeptide--D-alanyl-D-alanine ligase